MQVQEGVQASDRRKPQWPLVIIHEKAEALQICFKIRPKLCFVYYVHWQLKQCDIYACKICATTTDNLKIKAKGWKHKEGWDQTPQILLTNWSGCPKTNKYSSWKHYSWETKWKIIKLHWILDSTQTQHLRITNNVNQQCSSTARNVLNSETC